MSEHVIKLVVETPTVDRGPSTMDPVETVFRDLSLLHKASPYAVAMIKKELKKFSCKSMKWEKE